MKKKSYSLLLFVLINTSSFAQEEQSVQVAPIDINENSVNYFYNLNENNQTRIIDGNAAAAIQGTSSTNYFKSLQLLPSVNVETQDAYGLTVDQNMLRVRGQLGDTFSRLSTTIEGVPFGFNVGNGGTGYLLDQENTSSLEFTTGLTPANKGMGLGTTSGSLDLKLEKPKDEAGGMVTVGAGTDNFQKLFLRLDSGKINDMFNFFISSSTMSNDKWKGEGDIKRKNIELMSAIDLSDTTQLEIFGAYNIFDRDEYMPLTYAQTQSLSSNYSVDYNTTITGNKFTDAMYYDFNKQTFDEYFYYMALDTQMGNTKIKFKPYTLGSKGTRYFGDATTGTVKKMLIREEAYGMNLEFEHPLAEGKLYGGWWYQEMESTPPPELQKVYKINADGSLTYASTAMLTDIDKRVSNAPYLGYEKTIDKTHFNVGLRYLMYDFPGVTGYNTAGLADLSYDEALSASSGVKNGMHVDKSSSDVLLPSLALDHQLNQNWKIGGGYAKNYANPWQGPLWSIYNSKTAVFQAAGITLQDLWDELKLETSDNIEFFTQYDYKNFNFKNTLFYGKYKNKQVTVYDPALNLSYYKSDSEATSMGVELEGNYNLSKNTSIFASVYYNRFEFDNNILLATNTYLETQNNQIPDVAKIGGKLGVNFTYNNFTFSPLARYIGKRYGDAENKEKVDAYTVFDLNTKYVLKKEKLELSLALQNIFDKQYIGVVKNSLDDTRTGATSYYQGAPFSAVLSMVYKF
ncbi:MAG: TonB-dependent receptor [Candidatus Marinarcus sp.]|uniref:TonB-dependent receptor n=1 Tax=Candidatus Marinarcus sp. TaxID=3100987 RepID=UPI003AFFF7D7